MSTVTAREMVVFLREQGMTEQEIATEAGTTQPTIHRIITGESAEPKHSTWTRIQLAYLKRHAEIAKSQMPVSGQGDHAAP